MCRQDNTSMKIALPFSLFLTLSAVADSMQWGRVSGGIKQDDPLPYLVSFTLNEEHFCSGFIYNENWVVTAASCFDNKAFSQVRMKIGQSNLITPDTNEQTLSIFSLAKFDNYDPANKVNDIALVETSRRIDLTNFFKSIPYDEILDDDAPLSIAGWGATEENGYVSVSLRITTNIYVNSTACTGTTFPEYTTRNMICAGDPMGSEGPCEFDEGSPLVDANRNVVVGIVSRRGKPCGANYGSVFTRLSNFYAWMTRTAGPQPTALAAQFRSLLTP